MKHFPLSPSNFYCFRHKKKTLYIWKQCYSYRKSNHFNSQSNIFRFYGFIQIEELCHSFICLLLIAIRYLILAASVTTRSCQHIIMYAKWNCDFICETNNNRALDLLFSRFYSTSLSFTLYRLALTKGTSPPIEV